MINHAKASCSDLVPYNLAALVNVMDFMLGHFASCIWVASFVTKGKGEQVGGAGRHGEEQKAWVGHEVHMKHDTSSAT